jgi:hypothetical protein
VALSYIGVVYSPNYTVLRTTGNTVLMHSTVTEGRASPKSALTVHIARPQARDVLRATIGHIRPAAQGIHAGITQSRAALCVARRTRAVAVSDHF